MSHKALTPAALESDTDTAGREYQKMENGKLTLGEKITAGLTAVVVFMCFCMVAIGGTVRLTNSGMSIPDWPFIVMERQVLAGGEIREVRSLFPPINEYQWNTVYNTFITEVDGFTFANTSMTEFKRMFWIEWGHRGFAKTIGLVYLALMIAGLGHAKTRQNVGRLILWGFALLVLIAVLGGLAVLKHLPAENVAIHLTVAFLFTGVMILTLLKVVRPGLPVESRPSSNPLKLPLYATATVLLFQIFYGGLVAGLHAGHAYNTWPLMNGAILPEEAYRTDAGLIGTLMHNPAMVQFIHRWFAFVVLAVTIWFVVKSLSAGLTPLAKISIYGLAAVMVIQVIMGIVTLLSYVMVPIALLHQWLGIVLFGLTIVAGYEIVTGRVSFPATAEAKNPATADSTREKILNA